MNDYIWGWNDAIKFVVSNLRTAAERIELDVRGEVEHKETGKKYDAIVKSGDHVQARRIRELANELEIFWRYSGHDG